MERSDVERAEYVVDLVGNYRHWPGTTHKSSSFDVRGCDNDFRFI